MDDRNTKSQGIGYRILSFVVGVPLIAILYTACVILARGWAETYRPLSRDIAPIARLVFAVLFKPAQYLSHLLPQVAEWHHALGIVLIMGVIWGMAIMGLTLWIIAKVKKQQSTQQGAPPLPRAPLTGHSEGAR